MSLDLLSDWGQPTMLQLQGRRVYIVGGGLAGLYAACLLEKQHIPYSLLDTKPKLGGVF